MKRKWNIGKLRALLLIGPLIILSLSLTACFEMDPEAEAKIDKLVNEESGAFLEQATVQYGDVEVQDIEAETITKYDSVWPTGTIYAGSNLLGIVKYSDGSKFNAIYIPSENIIISDKHYEKITQSAIDDLSSPKLNILDLQIRNSARGIHMLPDDIVNYKMVVEYGESLTVRIITNSDISELKLTDFSELFEIMSNYESHILSVEIIQVNSIDKVEELSKRWNNQGTSYNSKIRYANEELDGEDEKLTQYGIVASMDIKSENGGTIRYIDINGDDFEYRVNE